LDRGTRIRTGDILTLKTSIGKNPYFFGISAFIDTLEIAIYNHANLPNPTSNGIFAGGGIGISSR
jgi:hypothetical protein